MTPATGSPGSLVVFRSPPRQEGLGGKRARERDSEPLFPNLAQAGRRRHEGIERTEPLGSDPPHVGRELLRHRWGRELKAGLGPAVDDGREGRKPWETLVLGSLQVCCELVFHLLARKQATPGDPRVDTGIETRDGIGKPTCGRREDKKTEHHWEHRMNHRYKLPNSRVGYARAQKRKAGRMGTDEKGDIFTQPVPPPPRAQRPVSIAGNASGAKVLHLKSFHRGVPAALFRDAHGRFSSIEGLGGIAVEDG